MNKLQKWIALILCACLLAGVSALAEVADEKPSEVTVAVMSTAAELKDSDVLAIVNGDPLTWADVEDTFNMLVSNYGSSYDMTLAENLQLFRAVALDNQISELLIWQQAKLNGLDQLTEEEIAAIHAAADEVWDSAIGSYIAQNAALTEASTEEEKAKATADAEAYFLQEVGVSQEIIREMHVKYDILDRMEALVVQDATVTDEEIEAAYQAKVAADKEMFENDLAAYVEYTNMVQQSQLAAMMYGMESDVENPWYKPDGFRAVKHILLPVDEALMNAYNEAQSKLEEQRNAEAGLVQGGEDVTALEAVPTDDASATGEAVATSAPVTEADVNNAKAAILESLVVKIDEINQKIAEGVDFDELIAIYGVNADGTPSDPGMVNEPGKTSGYEVAFGTNYVTEFIDAALSTENIGDVSAPYLSSFGVHIVKYIADVPGGPIEMTDLEREDARAQLLSARQSELNAAALSKWFDEAVIEFTGLVPSMVEIDLWIEEQNAAAAQEVSEEPVEADPAVEEEAPETPAEPEPTEEAAE